MPPPVVAASPRSKRKGPTKEELERSAREAEVKRERDELFAAERDANKIQESHDRQRDEYDAGEGFRVQRENELRLIHDQKEAINKMTIKMSGLQEQLEHEQVDTAREIVRLRTLSERLQNELSCTQKENYQSDQQLLADRNAVFDKNAALEVEMATARAHIKSLTEQRDRLDVTLTADIKALTLQLAQTKEAAVRTELELSLRLSTAQRAAAKAEALAGAMKEMLAQRESDDRKNTELLALMNRQLDESKTRQLAMLEDEKRRGRDAAAQAVTLEAQLKGSQEALSLAKSELAAAKRDSAGALTNIAALVAETREWKGKAKEELVQLRSQMGVDADTAAAQITLLRNDLAAAKIASTNCENKAQHMDRLLRTRDQQSRERIAFLNAQIASERGIISELVQRIRNMDEDFDSSSRTFSADIVQKQCEVAEVTKLLITEQRAALTDREKELAIRQANDAHFRGRIQDLESSVRKREIAAAQQQQQQSPSSNVDDQQQQLESAYGELARLEELLDQHHIVHRRSQLLADDLIERRQKLRQHQQQQQQEVAVAAAGGGGVGRYETVDVAAAEESAANGSPGMMTPQSSSVRAEQQLQQQNPTRDLTTIAALNGIALKELQRANLTQSSSTRELRPGTLIIVPQRSTDLSVKQVAEMHGMTAEEFLSIAANRGRFSTATDIVARVKPVTIRVAGRTPPSTPAGSAARQAQQQQQQQQQQTPPSSPASSPPQQQQQQAIPTSLPPRPPSQSGAKPRTGSAGGAGGMVNAQSASFVAAASGSGNNYGTAMDGTSLSSAAGGGGGWGGGASLAAENAELRAKLDKAEKERMAHIRIGLEAEAKLKAQVENQYQVVDALNAELTETRSAMNERILVLEKQRLMFEQREREWEKERTVMQQQNEAMRQQLLNLSQNRAAASGSGSGSGSGGGADPTRTTTTSAAASAAVATAGSPLPRSNDVQVPAPSSPTSPNASVHSVPAYSRFGSSANNNNNNNTNSKISTTAAASAPPSSMFPQQPAMGSAAASFASVGGTVPPSSVGGAVTITRTGPTAAQREDSTMSEDTAMPKEQAPSGNGMGVPAAFDDEDDDDVSSDDDDDADFDDDDDDDDENEDEL